MTTPDAAAPGSGRPAGTGRRILWGAADQGVYGLTNILLSIAVAVSVDREAFGAFSAVLIMYTITNGAVEGLVAEVFTVTHRKRDDGPTDGAGADGSELAAAAGAAVAIGLVVAAVALVASIFASGPLLGTLPAFAAIVPALYLQDTWRFALFAMGRPRSAFANDVVWAVVQLGALAAVKLTHHSSISAFVLAWGAGALAGALFGMVQTRTVPKPWLAWTWVRRHWGLGGRFAGEFLTLFGSAQLVLGVLVAAAGYGELARIRAAQVLYAPLQGLLNAARLAVTPIAVQIWTATPARLARFVTSVGVGLAGLSVLSGAAALLVPDALGRRLLGDSWEGVGPVLLPLAVMNTAVALGMGALTALRALQASRESLRVRLVVSGATLAFGAVGAVLFAAPGVAWGLAAAAAIGLVLMVLVTRRALEVRLLAAPAHVDR